MLRRAPKDETVYIPVVMSQSGIQELVYNDFHIGANADVTIIARLRY